MWPQKPIPECYSRLYSDRTCQSTRCYKINCNPKGRRYLTISQKVKKGPNVRSQRQSAPDTVYHTTVVASTVRRRYIINSLRAQKI